jgi:beta-glucuronidase
MVRREFSYLADDSEERVFLRIGAANYHTMIFLNHEYLGNHYGGSTPFFVELTGKLRSKNLIQICVNNTRTLDRVPMRNTDWFNYGGIYRDVELLRVPKSLSKHSTLRLLSMGRFKRSLLR